MLVLVVTRQLDRITDRQVEFRHYFLIDLACQLTQRSLVRRYLDGNDTLTRLTLDGRRSPIFAYRGYLRQFDSRTRGCRNGQVHHIGERVTVFLTETHDDIVLGTVVFEIAAVHTRYAVTQIGRDSCGTEAQTRGFLFVNRDFDIRTVVLTADIDVTRTRQLHTETACLVGKLTCLIEVIAVNLDINGVTAATRAIGSHLALVFHNLRIARHLFTKYLRDFPDGFVAFPFLVETDGHGYLVVHRAGEERCDGSIIVRTGRGVDKLNLRHKNHEACLQCAGGLQRLFDTRTALQFNRHGETSVILLLHKVGTDVTGEDRNKGQTEDAEDNQDSDGFMAQAHIQSLLIPAVNDIQHTYDGFLIPVFLACLIIDEVTVLVHMHFLRFEQLGAEHRSQRDSDKGRGTTNDRHNPSEFMEHDTRHTIEHRQRYEHSHEHEGGSDDRYPYFVRRIDSRLMRVFTTFDVAGDILQDHDGIVHNHTDGDG